MEHSKWNVVIHNLQNYSWTPTVTCKKVKQFPDSLVVYIRYCEQRSCGWGLRQPARQSWAWWRPGWGWWRSDGWSAYGRRHETYKKRVESSKERDCLNSFSAYKYICHAEQLDWLMCWYVWYMRLTDLCCWKWRRRCLRGWVESFLWWWVQKVAEAEAQTGLLGARHCRYHHHTLENIKTVLLIWS